MLSLVEIPVHLMRPAEVAIDCLPPEIMCYIFLLALNDSAEESEADLANLSRVCTRWRYMVMAAPRLWSYITIKATDVSTGFDARRLVSRLEMTKAALLDITLETPAQDEEQTNEGEASFPTPSAELPEAYQRGLSATVSLLHSAASRLRDLKVYLSLPSEAAILFPLPRSTASMKSLTVEVASGALPSCISLLAPGAACAIEELTLHVASASPTLLSSISAESLRSFTFTTESHLGKHIAELLSKASHLKTARIREPELSDSSRTTHSALKINTPLLQTLEISGHILSENVACWHAPVLEHLTIHPSLPTWNTRPWFFFPSLRTLTISSRKPSDAATNFPCILSQLPSLVVIDLPPCSSPTSQILELLTAPPNTSPSPIDGMNSVIVCGKLRLLRIRAYLEGFDAIVPALKAFIESSGQDSERGPVDIELVVLSKKQQSAWAVQQAYPNRVKVIATPPALQVLFRDG
jgi:hypothetical protein